MSDEWRDDDAYSKRRSATARGGAKAKSSSTATGTTTTRSSSASAVNTSGRPVPPPAGGNSIGQTKASEEDARAALVDKARQEREERARRKKQEESAGKIEAVVRGWLCRVRTRKELADETKRKLQDIEKIETVLGAAKKEFTLPLGAAVKLSRSAWMLYKLHPRNINVNKNQLRRPGMAAVQQQEALLCNVARVICGTLKSGAYETQWDDGARLRTSVLVENELSSGFPDQKKLFLCFELLKSNFFFEWIHVMLTVKCTQLLQSRLLRLSSTSEVVSPADWDAIDIVTFAHKRLMDKRKNQPLYALLLLSIPGLFVRVTSMETFQSLTLPVQSWECVLKALPVSNADGEKERDAQLLSRTGNLFSILTKVPQLVLDSSDLIYEIIWRLFQSLPKNTFVGSEGVAWTTGGVSQVDARVMAQLDVAHITTVLGQRCLRVNPAKDAMRRDADRKEWEAIGQGVMERSNASSATTKSRIFALMSGSNWARKLGWTGNKPSKRTGGEEEDAGAEDESESLLLKSTLSQTANNQPLFVRESALSDYLKLVAIFLLRWPPKATNPKSLSMLNAIAFTWPSTVERVWAFAEGRFAKRTQKPDLLDEFWSSSFVFLFIAVHFLLVTDESELYEGNVPMSRAVVERCVTKLNEALFQLDYSWVDAVGKKPVDVADADFARTYVMRAVRFLAQLRDIHSRRELTREQAWLLDKSSPSSSSPPPSSSSSFFASLLPVALGGRNESGRLSTQEQRYFDHGLFWSVPFYRRAKWFSDLLATERVIHQPPDQPPTYKLSVRRRNAGLDEAMPFFLKSDLKKRVYVVFVNEFGLPEAGIDSRGLFKEFIQTLAEVVFDPKRGLFAVSQEGDKGLFPNPRAKQYVGVDCVQMFNFAGRLLGKALFEGIVIQPEFSFFILAKLLGKLVTIGALASLDQDLFRNLLFLKNTNQDVKDLCLSFSIASSSIPGKEVELFPGGSQVEVTSGNKYKYVNMVAHYRLNVEGKEEHDAFVAGFRSVIQPEWIAPFTERELQTLISGRGGKLDVADLKANCTYGGGYFASSQVIVWFWEVVERDMDDKQRELLLRFVTACTRPPLLGFSQLEPRFQIQRVTLENMQLPTASTCFNTLKIPAYPSKAVLREKLIKAITSGAGFELT